MYYNVYVSFDAFYLKDLEIIISKMIYTIHLLQMILYIYIYIYIYIYKSLKMAGKKILQFKIPENKVS